MRNSRVAILGYGIAVGFILAVAFHSPAKMLLASDAPVASSAFSAK
jgi:hypothetical protein